MEEYEKQLALRLSQHPEHTPHPSGFPTDPSLSFQTWYDVSCGKRKNGRVYGVGGLAKTIWQRDRSFRMQIAYGEGSLTQPSLTPDMMETVRSLAHSKTACEVEARNAEIEELKKRQREMEEEMRRKIREYEESMRIFQQFMQ
ncbi:unnamed protein product [Vicia faba]|uniref:Uncharacterized protein n=1 Tax=Vicia faba TaxID=3906 RepID=A0AAV1A317_VICFA|nr:unnamed protein product [Vicia faba]